MSRAELVVKAMDAVFGDNLRLGLPEGISPSLAVSWWIALLIKGGESAELDRLAAGIASKWRTFGRGRREVARQALQERARDNGWSLDVERVNLARIGLVLAGRDLRREQTIRIGKRWIVDEEDHPAKVKPYDLLADYAIRWLAASAKAAATATLLDEPWPKESQPKSVRLDQTVALSDVTGGDSLQSLLDDSIAALLDSSREVTQINAAATEKDREVLDLLNIGYNLSEAAQELGIQAGTARKRLHDLRGRLP